jgi:hypothetical protein
LIISLDYDNAPSFNLSVFDSNLPTSRIVKIFMICFLCYFISINAFLHAQGVTNTFDLISFIRFQIESRK